MNSMVKKMALIVGLLIAFNGCVLDEIDPAMVTGSIKTLAEYGVYFGLKQGDVKDDKAQIAEEGIRVAIDVLKAESINDLVDLDKVLSKLPEDVSVMIAPVLNKINGKYVEIKDKIPADKAIYIMAVLEGSFDGVEKYRSLISTKGDASTSSIDSYETNLIKEAIEADKNI